MHSFSDSKNMPTQCFLHIIYTYTQSKCVVISMRKLVSWKWIITQQWHIKHLAHSTTGVSNKSGAMAPKTAPIFLGAKGVFFAAPDNAAQDIVNSLTGASSHAPRCRL